MEYSGIIDDKGREFMKVWAQANQITPTVSLYMTASSRVDVNIDMTPSQARELARHLVEAAEMALAR